MSKATYLTGVEPVQRQKTRAHSSMIALFMLFVVTFLSAFSMAGARSTTASAADDPPDFELIRFVSCFFGDQTLLAKMYQGATTDDIPFNLRSKSSITQGQDDVLFLMNRMIDFSGDSFTTVNENVLGRPIQKDPSAPANTTTKADAEKFNEGARYNPFDRFGVAGLNWSSYQGEWKYIMVKACQPNSDPEDPKTGLYYENRLVPQTTWESLPNTKDIRSEQMKKGVVSHSWMAFLNTTANFIFNIPKFIVALTIGLINFAFSDVIKVMGFDILLVGDGDESGLFGHMFNGIFLPFVVVAFTFTALYLFWTAFVKRQVRKGLTALLRSFGMLILAFIIAAKPALMLGIPNSVAVGLQAIIVQSLNVGLTGAGGLCETQRGMESEVRLAQGSDAGTASTEENVSMLEETSTQMRSVIGCSLWEQFLFKPWAQGQFGTDWNNTWAKDHIADWAPEKASAFNNGNDNAKMVGDAPVPLGGEVVANNWALFHLSTQTNVHAPNGKTGDSSKITAGIANDWWRVVDVLSNYEERVMNADGSEVKGQSAVGYNSPTTGGSSTPATPAAPNNPAPANPGAGGTPMWPSPIRELSSNYKGHSGIDIRSPTGTPIIASKNGVVDYVGTGRGYGIAVFVNFEDGTRGVYGHLSQPQVNAGDQVTKGQQMGLSGNTGNSTGPHLHFEVTTGKFDQVANREFTIKWLEGATDGQVMAGGTTSGGGGGNLPTTYTESKENPPLDAWDVWIGDSAGGRIMIALSATVIALVGVSAPLVFALMSAVYALGLALLMTFAPLMLLMGCWAGRGWEIFKGWLKLVIKAVLARVMCGALLVLSILLSNAAISIMETDNWWEGIVLMIIISYVLIKNRHRMIDALAAVRMTTSANFAPQAEKVSKRTMGFVKDTGRLSTSPLIGGTAAVVKGGSFTHGAAAATRNELRNIGPRNDFIRSANIAYNAASVAKRGADDDLVSEFTRCAECGKDPTGSSIIGMCADGSVLCKSCLEDGLRDDAEEVRIDWRKFKQDQAEAHHTEKGGEPRRTLKDQQLNRKVVASHLDEETREKDIEALHRASDEEKMEYLRRLARSTHEDLEQQRASIDTMPDIPAILAPYIDRVYLEDALEEGNYVYVAEMYNLALSTWAMDTFAWGFEDAASRVTDTIYEEQYKLAHQEDEEGL